MLYKGSKVIIPKSMQPQIPLRIHSSHQEAESCIRRAKYVLFWPGMTSEIKERVGQCSKCNEYLSKQQKEPLMTYKITTRTLKMVAQDLFTVAHTDYLVTMDYYTCSDYWELDCVLDTTSQTVIECATKAHFVRHGIPDCNHGQWTTVYFKSMRNLQQSESSNTPPLLLTTARVMAKSKLLLRLQKD